MKAGGMYLADKNNKILMPFGTEYSLFFRNKDVRRVSIGPVTIDGIDALNGKRMVLDAGEDWTLKGKIRDTDDSYNFKFIERTNKISEHRGTDPEDGLISISFQYEKIKSTFYKMRERRINSDGHGFLQSKSYPFDNIIVANYSSNNLSTQAEAGITVDGKNMTHSYGKTTLNIMEDDIHSFMFGLYGYNDTGGSIEEVITPKTKLICGTCGTKWAYTQKFCGECGTNLH